MITCDNIILSRGQAPVIGGLSLMCDAGETLLLTGANGTGKTTLLRSLAGLLAPDHGTISRKAGVLWLNAGVPAAARETPRQFLQYHAALKNAAFVLADDPFSIATFLDTPLEKLSSGWRQRVKLTRLAMDTAARTAWLLDEPSDHLDSAGQSVLAQLVHAHAREGGCAIIATHNAALWPQARQVVLA